MIRKLLNIAVKDFQNIHCLLKKFIKQKLAIKNSAIFKIYCNNLFVGVIELGNIDLKNQNCEIMYFVGNRNYWSKGVATKAINLCIDYAKKKKFTRYLLEFMEIIFQV